MLSFTRKTTVAIAIGMSNRVCASEASSVSLDITDTTGHTSNTDHRRRRTPRGQRGRRRRSTASATVDTDMGNENLSKRRGFLKIVSTSLGSMVAAVLAFPLIDSVVAVSLRKKQGHFAQLAQLVDLPSGSPVERTFADRTTDAFIEETLLRKVWVVKHSPSKLDVFSPICPHLGCSYNWHPERNQFVCPCHGSVFSLSGEVVGGPAPRPLDTLPIRIDGGAIYVEWEQFKVGIPQKVAV
jgi:menaquinol-cytochrome c reductase iron-sulfur subunit